MTKLKQLVCLNFFAKKLNMRVWKDEEQINLYTYFIMSYLFIILKLAVKSGE